MYLLTLKGFLYKLLVDIQNIPLGCDNHIYDNSLTHIIAKLSHNKLLSDIFYITLRATHHE